MSNSTDTHFIRLPLRLLTLHSEKLLKPHDLVVYGHVVALLQKITGKWSAKTATVPISEVARKSGFKRDTCSDSLIRLETFGFIKVLREPARPTVISLDGNLPAPRARPARQTGNAPFPHEESSIEDRELRARARHEELAALRLLASEIIRLNPNFTLEKTISAIFDHTLENKLDFTVYEIQTTVRQVFEENP